MQETGHKPIPEQYWGFLCYQIERGKFGENIFYTPKNEEAVKIIRQAENIVKESQIQKNPEIMEQLRALLQKTIQGDSQKHSSLISVPFPFMKTYLEHKIMGCTNTQTNIELNSYEGGDYDGVVVVSCQYPQNLKISLYLEPNPQKPITVTSNYKLTPKGPMIIGFRPYILYPNKVQNRDGESLYYINQAKIAAFLYLEGKLQIINPSTKSQTS